MVTSAYQAESCPGALTQYYHLSVSPFYMVAPPTPLSLLEPAAPFVLPLDVH